MTDYPSLILAVAPYVALFAFVVYCGARGWRRTDA